MHRDSHGTQPERHHESHRRQEWHHVGKASFSWARAPIPGGEHPRNFLSSLLSTHCNSPGFTLTSPGLSHPRLPWTNLHLLICSSILWVSHFQLSLFSLSSCLSLSFLIYLLFFFYFLFQIFLNTLIFPHSYCLIQLLF